MSRIARILRAEGLERILAVVGPPNEELRATLRRTSVVIVEHRGWPLGRTGSVQAGLEAVGADADVLLWPVDHPFVSTSTVARILEAGRRDALATWVLPTYRGRGGHPIFLRPPAQRAIAALPADAPLRSLLPQLGPQVLRLEVDDPAVVDAVHDPATYLTAAEAWIERGAPD